MNTKFLKGVVLVFNLCMSLVVFAQSGVNWTKHLTSEKAFIQNQGQFIFNGHGEDTSGVQYAYDGVNEDFYFSNHGVALLYSTKTKHERTPEEKAIRMEKKKQGFTSTEEFHAFEREGKKLDVSEDIIGIQWLGSNPNVSIMPEEITSYHHSYSYYDRSGTEHNKNFIPSFRKLVYKNLYLNIDVVYEVHPESGLKYSIVVHPGGDVTQVRLKYSKSPTLNVENELTIPTLFGEVTDHKPVTFYEGTPQSTVSSAFQLVNGEVRFDVGTYDHTKTLIIDPWTQSPVFASNWDCIWECEKDAAGNVYIIGGVTPLQLIKYNAAGAQQWVYNTPYDTTMWMGTMATDNAGTTYVTNGSAARIVKVNTAGGVVWNTPNPTGTQLLTEFWCIAFNCDMTRLIIGGTGGTGLTPTPYINQVDMNTGNISNKVAVTGGGSLLNSQEVRSLAPCGNGKYYFLSHDSIGYIHQNLTTCNPTTNITKASSGYDLGYKCEDWRYDNSGIMAIRHFGGFIYTTRGNQIHKRDFATANIVATAAIPGGAYTTGFGGATIGNAGIDIDNCGNIYVGSKNAVIKYDVNLTQLASYATTFNVYDVHVSTSGDIIACGASGNSSSASRTGAIQSIAASACVPTTITCCDATVCNPGILCASGGAVTLNPVTPGGTWSGGGAGFNTTTGVFSPTIAGVGTYYVTYTLACGAETIPIVVSTCTALQICKETNGNMTASLGTGGPYTWQQQVTTPGVGCVGGFGSCSGFFTVAAPSTTSWVTYATTATSTPPANSNPLRVTDGVTTINIPTVTDRNNLAACPSVLGFKISNFKAACENEKVKFEWYASEANEGIEYYVLQSSLDGVRYDEVTRRIATGENISDASYTFSTFVSQPEKQYYRIKTVNQDGTCSFSSDIMAQCGNLQQAEISLYPNPASETITLQFNRNFTADVRVVVRNLYGSEVINKKFSVNNEQYYLDISLEDLPCAVYSVSVEGVEEGSVAKQFKLIKQNP